VSHCEEVTSKDAVTVCQGMGRRISRLRATAKELRDENRKLIAEVERLRRGVQSMLDSPPLLVEIAHELLAESAHP
jgi:cell division protein FtsB